MNEELDELPPIAEGGARLLVAVSGSGRGEQAVRTAKALADAFGATWHAIHLRTPASAEDQVSSRRAADALGLAAQLGATISSEPAVDVATGLSAQLDAFPAAHLVIGAPTRIVGRGRLGAPFLRRLLLERPDLAVHIAPRGAPPSVERLVEPASSDRSSTPWSHHVMAFAFVMATLAVNEVLRLALTGRALGLLFLFPVMAAAARYGFKPALTAVVASVLSYDLFLLQPLLRLEPLAPSNVVLWVSLLGVATYTAWVTDALRRRVALSDRSAQESARIVTFAQSLARASQWDETARVVCEEFRVAMRAHAALFREKDGALVRAAAAPPEHVWGPLDQAALDWCWTTGEEAGAGTSNVTAADWRFEPLRTSLGMLGVLALLRTDGRSPIRADRQVLFATLVVQSSLALERLVLEDRWRSEAAGERNRT